MKKPLINVADAATYEERHGAHFEFSIAGLARVLGARSIGANVTRVPPGKAAFPLHYHHGNEEHFFVISGAGVLRYGADEYVVKALDYIVALPGGPESAHQLINTGTEELVYLGISTLTIPDVTGYPDSGKTGVRIGTEVAAGFLIADDAKVARAPAEYWKGEDGDRVAEIVSRQPPGAPA